MLLLVKGKNKKKGHNLFDLDALLGVLEVCIFHIGHEKTKRLFENIKRYVIII